MALRLTAVLALCLLGLLVVNCQGAEKKKAKITHKVSAGAVLAAGFQQGAIARAGHVQSRLGRAFYG